MKLIFLAALMLSFRITVKDPETDKKEAQSAYNFLNQIRSNPQQFIEKFAFLKDVKAMPTLHWNDTLAKVAETKALDMAKRRFFNHVDPDGYGINYYINKAGYNLNEDWLKDHKANFFESIGAGSNSGQEAIERLILDSNTPSLGHRKHLLGLDEWNSSLADIGIGYVVSNGEAPFSSYICVIIAKHDW